MGWVWFDVLGAGVWRFVRWLSASALGRAFLAALGLAGAALLVFHAGARRGRVAERANQEERAARTLEKRRQVEDEVRDLDDDELVRRAARWVRH